MLAAQVTADNHGSRYTGRNRLMVDVALNDLHLASQCLDLGDQGVDHGDQRADRGGVGAHHAGMGLQLWRAQRGLDAFGRSVDAALPPGPAQCGGDLAVGKSAPGIG